MSTFFGYRLASIFDTRVKLDAWYLNIDPDAASTINPDGSTIEKGVLLLEDEVEEEESNSRMHDEDSCDEIDLDEDMVDDYCLAGEDETRTFLSFVILHPSDAIHQGS